VRAVLFGRHPDQAALDLKLRRYLAVLHSTGLARYVTATDPRLTYTAPLTDLLEFDFRPAIGDPGHDQSLYLFGDPPTEDGGGALTFAWSITILADDLIRIERLRPGTHTAELLANYDSGLSAGLPLAGSGLLARFHERLPAGTTWMVGCTARPTADLGAVVTSLDRLGEGTIAQLFGLAPAEPYRTWAALWHSRASLPYRLGAALLALAARTDELRRGH
jgi:hypothetical protein